MVNSRDLCTKMYTIPKISESKLTKHLTHEIGNQKFTLSPKNRTREILFKNVHCLKNIPLKNRACHSWSKCKGRKYSYTSAMSAYAPAVTGSDFMLKFRLFNIAEIRIIFGTVFLK